MSSELGEHKMISPMVARQVPDPFDREGWLFELKWDGFRAICFVDKGVVRFVSRNQRSLSERFPVLQEGSKDVRESHARAPKSDAQLRNSELPSEFDS